MTEGKYGFSSESFLYINLRTTLKNEKEGRTTMEQQMKDSNQLYSNIDLHAVLSSNGRFLYISSNCKQLLLYEQKDLLGCF